MKFLTTIRFDPTDSYVFENAAPPGEWAIPGGFTFAGMSSDALVGKAGQAFANGFVSLESFGHSTFASVAEITQQVLNDLTEKLADHVGLVCGAPDREAAMQAAKYELDFVVGLCRDVNVNTVFCIRRTHTEAGEIHEEFRTISPPAETHAAGVHTRVWEIVDDDPAAGNGVAE